MAISGNQWQSGRRSREPQVELRLALTGFGGRAQRGDCSRLLRGFVKRIALDGAILLVRSEVVIVPAERSQPGPQFSQRVLAARHVGPSRAHVPHRLLNARVAEGDVCAMGRASWGSESIMGITASRGKLRELREAPRSAQRRTERNGRGSSRM